MSDLHTLQTRAMQIRQKYNELNARDGRNAWGPKDYAMGFAGDFGDLQKLVMAKENMRMIEDADSKLEHEIADCLWSLLVLAEHYGIDITKAFERTMNELDARITAS